MRNEDAIKRLEIDSATATLPANWIYDEPFRFRLQKAMSERYVHAGSGPTFQAVEFVIREIHFEDKGAIFVSGGLAGGNSLHGSLILTQNGVRREISIEETFNTGGGYTIIQDWEDRMIKAVLVDIDRALLSFRENHN